jgi:hypothetical protein
MTVSRPRTLRPYKLVLLVVLAVAALVPLAGSEAATPDSGTISSSNPVVMWSGPFKAPLPGTSCAGPNNPACDNYKLTIQPPTGSYEVDIELQPFAAGDWDLYVYSPSGDLAGSSGNAPSQLETVKLVNPPAGTYTVTASPFAPSPGLQSYSASATLVGAGAATPSSVGSEHITYADYAAPADVGGQSSGEPSIGADWKSGNVMFQAGLDALRVSFDDCASPGTPTWKNVSFLTAAAASLDPIGFCDHQTGRWFSSQLSGTTSLAALTDDDGTTWTQSEGGPGNGGVDHQTIGGGPYHAPLSGTPVYPNAVYYCSQDLVAALCARSDTGGVTFSPAVPIYTSECTGLHGHVKVAPDGTVYVPNKDCGGHQGVVVSEDNGLTWSVRTVPQSTKGDWDPSVGIASDGTVYLGYADADGHEKVAVSHDQGRTWSNVFDVGAPFGVNHAAFSVAVAGDPNRASVGFLGTTEPSAGAFGDNPNWPGVWYLYVATTYDGGATWTTVNATPNDPVQKGSICAGGFNGCPNGTRNLLDFNDATVDAQGRTLIGYADGCVDACVTGGPGSFTAMASIARQVSGKRLLAAYDVAGVPAAPAVTAKANGTANLVSWSEPDDHGSAITGYKVYRGASAGSTALLASVGADQRSYNDSAITAGQSYVYRVTAVNSAGEGPSCQAVAPSTGPGPAAAGNPCDETGVTVLTDGSGDSLDKDPGHDVQALSIAEPRSIGLGKIEFILKVASLESVPKNTVWPVLFAEPDGTDHWVRMKSDALGAVTYGYGTGTSYTGTQAGAADASSSYSADGTIRIVLARDAIGVKAGDRLSGFLTRVSVSAVAASLTPDNMPDSLARSGEYTVHGNENCVVPKPDLAVANSDVGYFAQKSSNGHSVTIVGTVHNAGTLAASAVKVRITVDGVQVGSLQTIPSIAVGSFGRATVQWSTNGANGDHVIVVTADPAGAIDESNEANNAGSRTLHIQGSKVTG